MHDLQESAAVAEHTQQEQHPENDLLLDNVVPRFSALAGSKHSVLVLMGVWMIFGPISILSVVALVAALVDMRDSASSVTSALGAAALLALCLTILYKQTRRFGKR